MPITSSGKHLPYPKDSKSYISHKIGKLKREGKSHDQAVAIALSMARERKKA